MKLLLIVIFISLATIYVKTNKLEKQVIKLEDKLNK